MEIVTINTITEYLKKQVEEHIPIAPSLWIDSAQKINVLLGDEHDKLFEIQQKVAKIKVGYIEQDKTVSEAKTRVEASEEYKEYQLQKAKIGRIEEFIRLAKIQARTRTEEMKGYNL